MCSLWSLLVRGCWAAAKVCGLSPCGGPGTCSGSIEEEPPDIFYFILFHIIWCSERYILYGWPPPGGGKSWNCDMILIVTKYVVQRDFHSAVISLSGGSDDSLPFAGALFGGDRALFWGRGKGWKSVWWICWKIDPTPPLRRFLFQRKPKCYNQICFSVPRHKYLHYRQHHQNQLNTCELVLGSIIIIIIIVITIIIPIITSRLVNWGFLCWEAGAG